MFSSRALSENHICSISDSTPFLPLVFVVVVVVFQASKLRVKEITEVRSKARTQPK